MLVAVPEDLLGLVRVAAAGQQPGQLPGGMLVAGAGQVPEDLLGLVRVAAADQQPGQLPGGMLVAALARFRRICSAWSGSPRSSSSPASSRAA